jgi:O-antigen ligase
VLKFSIKKELFLSFLLAISIIKLVIPIGSIPGIIFSLIYLMIYILKKKHFAVSFSLYNLPICICISIYLFAMVKTGQVYRTNITELGNFFVVSVLLLVFSTKEKFDWDFFLKKSGMMISSSMFFVSLFSLYKFFLLTKGIEITLIKNNLNELGKYPWGTSLISDYNMYSLGLFSGVFSSIDFLKRHSLSPQSKAFYIFNIILLVVSILLSGSRRGLLTILFFVLIFFIKFTWKIVVKGIKKTYKIKMKNLKLLAIIAIPLFLFFTLEATVFNHSSLATQSNNNEQINILSVRAETLFNKSSNTSVKYRGLDSRFPLWQYGLEKIDEYNISEFIFGKDFEYLEDYSQFYNTQKLILPNTYLVKETYPHNTFLSVIHYSGVIGLLFYFLLIFTVSYKLFHSYQKGNNSSLIHGLFLLTLIFYLVSGNTFFSSTHLCILMIVSSINYTSCKKNLLKAN